MQKINLQQLVVKIQSIANQTGRTDKTVNLLAVSKTRSTDEIATLADQGQRLFGENYLQEALDKIQALKQRKLEWHYIGKIQSNKTRQIATHFDWVHTIDRLKIAQRLNDQRPAELPPLNICLQVNSSGEESKGGVTFSEISEVATKINELPHLKLRGLMTLPAPTEGTELQRPAFRKLREALEILQQKGLDLDTLSMGTTNDFEAAILEGATLLRIGTALFGPRKYA